jgi:hypothetical protein
MPSFPMKKKRCGWNLNFWETLRDLGKNAEGDLVWKEEGWKKRQKN